jgi:hypothetical protein
MTATQTIYAAAGSPPMIGDASGVCRLCGAEGTGQLFDKWVKDGFTNFDLLQGGEIACHACLFCAEEKSVLIQARLNKDKPQKTRNYSHFVLRGEWFPLSKGDKRKMRELLSQSPDVAVIAESGQKHLCFRARPGWWQFEEQALLPCWDKVSSLLPVIEELMVDFSKSEIESDHYLQYRIIKFGVERWRKLSESLRPVRLAPHFQLALFLAQKTEDE